MRRFCLALAVLIGLTACGQKGDLYLPREPVPAAAPAAPPAVEPADAPDPVDAAEPAQPATPAKASESDRDAA